MTPSDSPTKTTATSLTDPLIYTGLAIACLFLIPKIISSDFPRSLGAANTMATPKSKVPSDKKGSPSVQFTTAAAAEKESSSNDHDQVRSSGGPVEVGYRRRSANAPADIQ